jgi:ornithine cyclodeaminase
MHCVRPLRRVRVWSRNDAHAREFAEREAQRVGIPIEVTRSVEAAVKGADLVCTTTAARDPILQGEWLSPGAHVNAVGSSFATHRELDATAVKRARLYTDCRESAANEAGDFLIAKREGAFGDEHLLGELGEVLLGRVPGRRSPDDVTLYKSLGVAVEDLAAASFLLQRAAETNRGSLIDWGSSP